MTLTLVTKRPVKETHWEEIPWWQSTSERAETWAQTASSCAQTEEMNFFEVPSFSELHTNCTEGYARFELTRSTWSSTASSRVRVYSQEQIPTESLVPLIIP